MERNYAEEQEEDDEEEALSLSDLPLIHHSRKENELDQNINPRMETDQTHEEFDFCSLSKEPEMCAADEVFFQGQIMPLRRHSVSSEKGLLQYCNATRSVSRSESMDRCYSGGFISSRSSSISSHQSSSSSGSRSSISTTYKPKLPPRNQFHSHPSPSPRLIHRQGMMIGGTSQRNHAKKSSTVWNIFRLGLVTTPPEIAFQDLKSRCSSNIATNCSRNSSSSSISTSINSPNRKKKQTRGGLFSVSCKCSADAVDTVPSEVVIIKRSASESDYVEANAVEAATKKQTARKHLSHHRTFEWLKQLSVEAAEDAA